MRNHRAFGCFFLALILTFGSMPALALSEEVSEPKVVVSAQDDPTVVASGTCGTCPWSIDSNGLLTIGAGELGDTGEWPWSYYVSGSQSTDVELPEVWINADLAAGNQSVDYDFVITSVKLDGRVVAGKSIAGLFDSFNVKTLDLTQLDVSNVQNMSRAFASQTIESINTSGWDTSNVTSMDNAFDGCSSLKTLDLSSWRTPSLASMRFAFCGCSELTSLDVSGFDVSHVTTMDNAFNNCKALTSMDLSTWDIRNATATQDMFWKCSLSSFEVGTHYNTSMDGALPAATAENGKWWSTKDQKWFTVEEIASQRNGIADKYLNYEGKIEAKDIGLAVVSAIPDQAHTGSSIEPRPVVTFGEEVLQLGTDYTLSYANNVNVGTATVSITGKGSFTGTKFVSFAIVQAQPRDGWVDLAGGKKVYRKNGVLVIGWMDLGSSKYWFHDDGAMATGWTDVDVADKTMHYYFNPASGNLVRSTWFQIDGKTYYFRPSGNLAIGWATISDNGVDKKYYLDENGQLLTGWQDIEINGNLMHYYFRPSGSMATGWATIDGWHYWFRPSGNMATGFADVDDPYKRYFDEQGHMLTGWQRIGGKCYYFRPSGALELVKDCIANYEFTNKGVLSTCPASAQTEGEIVELA